jgi:peptide/nickel transport system substrate-binding protein
MSERNYWKRISRNRLSRRGLLRTSARAGVGAAGLALVGCGDDDDDGQPAAAAVQQQQQQAQQAAQVEQQAEQQAQEQAMQEEQAQSSADAAEQQQQQAAAAQAAAEGGPKHGGIVRIPGQDGGLFDPAIAIHGGTYAGVFQIYDWLNYLDEGFVLTEGMADLPEVVDELNYIYTIKPNVFWHNKPPVEGRQFTAEDAAFGLERFGFDNPEFVFRDRYALIERFDPVDTLTMHVEAGEVFSPILAAIGEDNALMVARDVVDAFGDPAISTDFEAQIGTGAMVGVSREPEVELVLERHPNYYKEGQPYFDGYRQISIPDAALRVSAFVDGQLDFLNSQWSGSVTDLEAARAELGEEAVTGVPNPVTYGIAQHIHTEVEPYTDARVRTALHLATDREQLNAITLGGGTIGGPVAAAIAPYGKSVDELREIPGYRSGDLRQEDLAEARRLLDASGIDLGNLPAMQVWTSVSDYGQVQQQNFAEIGYNIEIQELATADALAARQARDGFSIMMLGQQGASDPDLLFNDLHTTGGQNYGNFSDPAIDEMLVKGRTTFAVEDRKAIYDEIQSTLLEEFAPRLWWHWSQATIGHRPWLQGYYPTPGITPTNQVMNQCWFDDTRTI